MKNFNDPTVSRTRDFPACSKVSQPTAPKRAPRNYCNCYVLISTEYWCTISLKIKAFRGKNTGENSTKRYLCVYLHAFVGSTDKQHLERVEEDRVTKKIFTQELEGTRRRGRTRKRWKEEVERDLQVFGVRRWRELVADREKWKDIVRQAKAHSGP